MKRRQGLKALPTLFGALICAGLLSCNSNHALPNLGPDTPADDQSTIKIGLITVLTGDLSGTGPIERNAAELAVEQINALGGILGRNVELTIKDYGGDADTAAMLATQLIDEGNVGLLAAEGSGASIAVSAVTTPAKIPQISCCSTSTSLTTAMDNDFLFRTAPSDVLQAKVIVQLASTSDVMGSRGAVVYIDNSYGQSLKEALTTGFTGGPIEIVGYFPYAENAGDSDFATIVQNVLAAEMGGSAAPITFIILAAYDMSGGRFMNSWARLTSRTDMFWVPTDGCYGQVFLDTVQPSYPLAFANMLGTAPGAIPSADYDFFHDAYISTFNIQPPHDIDSPFAAHEYDAAMLMMLAIEAAGSTDGTAIAAALHKVSANTSGSDQRYGPKEIGKALESIALGKDVNYDGASGPVDFDVNGDVISGYQIWQVTSTTPGVPFTPTTPLSFSVKRYVDPSALVSP